MRVLSAAIVLSLVTVIASAQPLQRTVTRLPGAVTLRHAGPAPRAYTPQQRSLAVQKLLNLTSAPTLGQPVSLSPSAPFIAGVAELDFGDAVEVVSGNINTNGTPGGLAVWTKPSGFIRILFNARAGQRTVVDCRSTTTAQHFSYTVDSGSGTTPISQDGHFLIALDKAATNKTVSLRVVNEQAEYWYFFGCEISPF